jgi:multisubunit Na+/H+ antiporter MnhE subunit
MPIDIIGITSLLIALINIILGFYVFAKNPRKTNNIVYAVSVSSISVWIVLTYLYNNPSFWEPELWLKFVYLASYGMLLAQLGFAYFFPRKKKDKFWYFAIPIILSIIPSFYVLIIQDSVKFLL